jgi:tetratricopeptide (TPR) repeat protein
MLLKVNSNDNELVVSNQPIEVVMSEDGLSPLSLVVPPYEDIAEIAALKNTHFSIKAWSTEQRKPMIEALKLEQAKLERKASKFADSAIFFNRLANFSSIAGEFHRAELFLRQASQIDHDPFYVNGVIENLIAQQRHPEAETMLSQTDLTKNVFANLRLAGMYATRMEIGRAVDRVNAALAIDPLDFGARLFDGALKLWNGEYERAILSFRIASEKRPNSAALHTNMAVAYVRLGQNEKALQSLKLAVAIDPLSLNSLMFLADISHAMNRSEDAIPSLRYYIRYEQQNSFVWDKLARALLKIKEASEAIAALKRQASLKDGSAVWNNLGVAYYVKGDKKKALESFQHAVSKGVAENTISLYIATTNFAALSTEMDMAGSDVLKIVDEVLRTDTRHLFASRRELSRMFFIKFTNLIRVKRFQDAYEFAEELLVWPGAGFDLVTGMAMNLLAVYSLSENMQQRALEIADKFSEVAITGSFHEEEDRTRLLNNIAFVYAELGQLDRAARHLQAISNQIHKSAYPTATSGLVHFKKGHLDRADQLYSEALRLSTDQADKARIRQKWNLELGKASLETDPKRAYRYLTKALEEKAEPSLTNQASALIGGIQLRLPLK